MGAVVDENGGAMKTAWRILGLLFLARPAAAADDTWGIEAQLGGAWNLPLPVRIRQEGQEELSFTGRWSTRALEPPLYYVLRASSWSGDCGWALDLTHHKVYLGNPPPEVGDFSVSHGYNLVTLHRLVRRGGWHYGAGAGLVVAHPEGEVRGRGLDEHRGLFHGGYYLSGPTVSGLVGRAGSGAAGPLMAAELRVTLSYARVPVSGGHARVPNIALHATLGAGWNWAR